MLMLMLRANSFFANDTATLFEDDSWEEVQNKALKDL